MPAKNSTKRGVNFLFYAIPAFLVAGFFIFGGQAKAADTILYQENFDSGAANGWQEKADPGAIWQVADGKYHLKIPVHDAYAESIYQNGSSWQDYKFSFDVDLTSGVDRSIFFRRQDAENYYQLSLRGFWHWAPDDTPIIDLARCYQGQCAGGGYYNHLAYYLFPNSGDLNHETDHFDIEAIGNTIKIFYNHSLVINWQEPNDNYPHSGTIGFSSWSGADGNTDAAWDNLVVRGISEQNLTPTLSDLGQLKSDGITPIAEGASAFNTVVFHGMPTSPPGNQVQIQIEVQPSAIAFNNISTVSSSFAASGQVASTTVANLSPGQYHWQARAVDSQGNASAWQTMSNPTVTVDFSIPRNPVIIVPGILGSELYTETPDIIWIDPIDYIPDPFDLKLDSLKMDDQGNSKIKLIAPDIIRSVYGSDFYGGLIKYLEDKGYKEGTDLFVFPYDWRMDLDQVAGDNFPCQSTTTLKCLIDEVKQKTKSEKIDIIAHSMGGLVVKDYVAKFGQESIDKFIDMATPHLGTPLAAKILNYGDNLDIGYGYYFLSTGKVRDVSQNMPAIYQLLPSQQYFNLPDNEYEYYIENSLATKINLPTGELNYLDSIEFLSKTGNENRYYFLNKNFILHSQIDNIKIGNSYNISGCGIATVGKIKSEGKKAFFWNKYSIEYIDGDNTVPLRSSDYYGDKNREYYLKGGGHSQIPGNEAVKEFVGLILAGKENEFNFSAHNNFSQSDDICGISGYELSFHCPADMHVYDDQGNHVGPVTNNDIENNIPGAHYDIIDGNKFVFLPQGKNYKIIGESTGTGTLEIAVNTVENNEYTKTTYFNSIPLLSNSTNVELNLGDNQANIAVKVDENGDGVFEEEKTPDSILTGEEMDDLVKPETIISLFGAKENNGYYGSDVKIDLAATDDNSGVLKTEYSLDKGKTWINYVREFALTQNGTTTILYSSTDRAGNREENKTEIIKIDTEKPELIILLPQENQEIEHNKILNVEYLANDQYSGLSELPEIYFDGQKMEGGNVDLFNYSIGQHKIKLKVSDLAGNYSEKENSFYVTASIDSAISDIERLYSEKEIFKEKTKDDLIDDFNWINEYQERNSKKEIRREGIEKEILDKCIAKKGNNWCEEKIGKVLDKILYRMDNVSQKLLKLKYELISQKVYRYKKIDWLTNKAVSIIEDNIKYLINNIK